MISCLLLAGMATVLSHAQNEPASREFNPADTLIHADSLVPLPTAHMNSDTFFISHHSPRKAMLYSLILPGLGQVYNRKYWKIPFIYGGAGAFLYYINFNQAQHAKFKKALFANKLTEGSAVIDGYEYQYSQLKRINDIYRRYRDYSIAGFAAMYLLNVIDAMVDAYFVRYDISDDLSLRLKPAVIQNTGVMGETASLGFRINIDF